MTLLNEKKVGCVHGSAFGMPGYMRISYATSDENLRRGLERIGEFCLEIAKENNMTLAAIKNGH
jgi:aspartate aminotransferase